MRSKNGVNPGQGRLREFYEAADQLPSVERRSFLRKGLVSAGGLLLGGAGAALGGAKVARAASKENDLPPNVPPWTRQLGDPVVSRPYGKPSHFKKGIIRRNVPWLTVGRETSVSFTPLQDLHGTITPNGLFFERYHAGRPHVDPSKHRLMIHGLVKRPLLLTMDDLMRFPSVSVIHFLECPANGGMEWRGAQLNSLQFTHGMVSCAEWTGVRLSTLLDEVGLKTDAAWLLAEGADGAAMARSIPLHKGLDDCLVVYGQNGEALRPEQGFPVRLIVPGWEGNVNVKWLRRIKVGDQPWFTREETSKYTDLMPSGRAREFTWVMGTKSVITFPCPEKPLHRGKGLYEISGLAWTGRGKIKRVDVSIDGGVNWRTAQLQQPVRDKALTRFRIEWQWDGGPALLQSRAIDETGDVQPTLQQLRAVRGENSIYHNSSIQTWQVKRDGSVNDVQLSYKS
jgi:sulfane dehydrogenase subunit SoxC